MRPHLLRADSTSTTVHLHAIALKACAKHHTWAQTILVPKRRCNAFPIAESRRNNMLCSNSTQCCRAGNRLEHGHVRPVQVVPSNAPDRPGSPGTGRTPIHDGVPCAAVRLEGRMGQEMQNTRSDDRKGHGQCVFLCEGCRCKRQLRPPPPSRPSLSRLTSCWVAL